MNPWIPLAAGILILHVLWILWVIFGAFLTRGRPRLTLFHLGSLGYGFLIEVLPFPCPLTLAEQWARRRAGLSSYDEAFLTYYLERLIYPDIAMEALIWGAAAVCIINASIYIHRFLPLRKRSLS
jgi:hypothetical protein